MTSILRGTLAALVFTSTVWLAAPAAAADDRDTCMKESGDEAIAACTRAINSGRYSGRQLAALLSNRCAEWPDKQENDKAIEDCSQALKLDPTSAEALSNRAHAYFAKDQYDRAIEDLNQAIRLSPNDADLFNNRGLAYENKDQHDRAIEDFNQAIRLKPDHAMAFFGRASSWELKLDLQHALADYKKFSELAPSDPDGPVAIARVTKRLRGR